MRTHTHFYFKFCIFLQSVGANVHTHTLNTYKETKTFISLPHFFLWFRSNFAHFPFRLIIFEHTQIHKLSKFSIRNAFAYYEIFRFAIPDMCAECIVCLCVPGMWSAERLTSIKKIGASTASITGQCFCIGSNCGSWYVRRGCETACMWMCDCVCM